MLRLSLCAACVLTLVGCTTESEVDKCVNAQIKALGPKADEQEKTSMEAVARIHCLKAASGKSS